MYNKKYIDSIKDKQNPTQEEIDLAYDIIWEARLEAEVDRNDVWEAMYGEYDAHE